jgi:hypothetical protein
MRLYTDKLHNGSNSIFIESILEGMSADDIDYTGYLDCALLGRRPGCCGPLSALLNSVQALAIFY